MTFLYIVSAVMVALGLVLANYSVSQTERFYARFMVLAGVIVIVLPWMWGK